MNTNKRLSLFFATAIVSLVVTQTASASYNGFNSYVNYDLLCQSADGLQVTANDLKGCFAAEFRHSDYYGKLASRSNRIKHAAKRLHQRGLSKSTCNWRSEIQSLDDLVCELRTLVGKSVHYSHDCDPICQATVRKIRLLMVNADRYVNGLQRALRRAEHVSRPNSYYHNGPRYRETAPVKFLEPLRHNDVAPSYAPRGEITRRGARRFSLK